VSPGSNPYKIVSEQLHSLRAAAQDVLIKDGPGPGNSGITPLISAFNSHLEQVRELLAEDDAALQTIAHIEPIRTIQERLDSSYHRTARQQLLISVPTLLHALAPYGASPTPDLGNHETAARMFETTPEADPPDTEREDVTQLFQRRVLNADLPRWFDESRTAGWPLACIVMDIDHFKSFNEDFGHDKGDEVLLAVASTIRSAVRGRGRGYRWGAGDELVIVLPNCTVPEAAAVAERIRGEVRNLGVSGLERPITLSAGVAGIPGPAMSADDLRTRADAALLLSKSAGRDCVRVDDVDQSVGSRGKERRLQATDDEIQSIVRWLGSHRVAVRRSGARQLVELVYKKTVFHVDDVRIAVSTLLKDSEAEIRLAGLEVLNALMTHERDAVGRRYVRLLEQLAESDPSIQVRARLMSTIGSSADEAYLPRIYVGINAWDEETYKQVSPVVALNGLAVNTPLRRKIRDELLDLIERAIEPGLSRYMAALDYVERQ
jgi:diguanylate cyclase (GGDEF)-like protein